jgi:hypothetical protein
VLSSDCGAECDPACEANECLGRALGVLRKEDKRLATRAAARQRIYDCDERAHGPQTQRCAMLAVRVDWGGDCGYKSLPRRHYVTLDLVQWHLRCLKSEERDRNWTNFVTSRLMLVLRMSPMSFGQAWITCTVTVTVTATVTLTLTSASSSRTERSLHDTNNLASRKHQMSWRATADRTETNESLANGSAVAETSRIEVSVSCAGSSKVGPSIVRSSEHTAVPAVETSPMPWHRCRAIDT